MTDSFDGKSGHDFFTDSFDDNSGPDFFTNKTTLRAAVTFWKMTSLLKLQRVQNYLLD